MHVRKPSPAEETCFMHASLASHIRRFSGSSIVGAPLAALPPCRTTAGWLLARRKDVRALSKVSFSAGANGQLQGSIPTPPL